VWAFTVAEYDPILIPIELQGLDKAVDRAIGRFEELGKKAVAQGKLSSGEFERSARKISAAIANIKPPSLQPGDTEKVVSRYRQIGQLIEKELSRAKLPGQSPREVSAAISQIERLGREAKRALEGQSATLISDSSVRDAIGKLRGLQQQASRELGGIKAVVPEPDAAAIGKWKALGKKLADAVASETKNLPPIDPPLLAPSGFSAWRATLGGFFGSIGGQLARTLTDAIGTGIKAAGGFVVDSVKEYAQVDAALNKIGALSSASKVQLAALEEQIIQTGIASTQPTREIAKFSEQLVKSGLDVDSTVSTLKPAAIAADATGEGIAKIGKNLSTLRTAFKLSNEQMGQAANMLTASLTASQNATSTNFDTFNTYFKGSILKGETNIKALQRQFNLFNLMMSTGVRASTAGTGLDAIFGNLISGSEKTRESLKGIKADLDEMGVKTVEVFKVDEEGKVQLQDYQKTLLDLRQSYLDYKRVYGEGAAEEEFRKAFGKQGFRALAALANQSDEAIRKTVERSSQALNSNILDKFFKAATSGLSGAMKVTEGAIDGLKARVGSSFSEIATIAIATGGILVTQIAQSPAWGELKKAGENLLGAFGLEGVQMTLASLTKAVADSIGGIVRIVAGLTNAIANTFKSLQGNELNFFIGALSNLMNGLKGVGQAATTILAPAFAIVGSAVGAAVGIIGGAVGAIGRFFGEVAKAPGFSEGLWQLAGGFQSIFSAIANFLIPILQSLGATIAPLGSTIGSLIGMLASGLAGALQLVGGLISTLGSIIASTLSPVLEGGRAAFAALAGVIGGQVSPAFQEAITSIGGALTAFGNLIALITTPLVSALTTATGGVSGLGSVLGSIVNIAGSVAGAVLSLVGAIARLASGFLSLVPGAQQGSAALASAGNSTVALNNALRGLASLLDTVARGWQMIGQVFSGSNFIDGIRGSFMSLNEAISDTTSRLFSMRNLASSAGNLIAGARASGGPVAANKAYLVGELGAELFVPSRPGHILRADQTALLAAYERSPRRFGGAFATGTGLDLSSAIPIDNAGTYVKLMANVSAKTVSAIERSQSPVVREISKKVGSLSEFIQGLYDNAKELIGKVLTDGWAKVGQIFQAIQSWVQAAQSWVQGKIDRAISALGNVWKKVDDVYKAGISLFRLHNSLYECCSSTLKVVSQFYEMVRQGFQGLSNLSIAQPSESMPPVVSEQAGNAYYSPPKPSTPTSSSGGTLSLASLLSGSNWSASQVKKGSNEGIFKLAGYSQQFIDLIKVFEGFSARSYDDGVGVQTIGFGSAATSGNKKVLAALRRGSVSIEEANDLLLDELSRHDPRKAIIGKLSFTPNENQLAALMSLWYNGGMGIINALIKKGNSAKAISENIIGHWVNKGTSTETGLRARRKVEAKLFNSSAIESAPPSSTFPSLGSLGNLFSGVSTTGSALSTSQLATSSVAARVVNAARNWVGKEFAPGVLAQCANFVRQVLKDAGVQVGVTQKAIDGLPSGSALASSFFGDDIGTIIKDKSQLRPGDLVAWAQTYGNWGPNVVTHVGVYSGNGKVIDRGNSALKERSIDTFKRFLYGVRPKAYGASSPVAMPSMPSMPSIKLPSLDPISTPLPSTPTVAMPIGTETTARSGSLIEFKFTTDKNSSTVTASVSDLRRLETRINSREFLDDLTRQLASRFRGDDRLRFSIGL
jgi:TP901 family phage tail tape measure protein